MITSDERQQQHENLERVTERIGHAILEFFKAPRAQFRAADLHQFVEERVSRVAPNSPYRIMLALKRKRLIDYALISRSGSLYRIVRYAPPDRQLRLFSEEEISQLKESIENANN
jgi:hypothetical protein